MYLGWWMGLIVFNLLWWIKDGWPSPPSIHGVWEWRATPFSVRLLCGYGIQIYGIIIFAKILSDLESSGPYIFFNSQYSTMAESTMTQSVFSREGIFPALEGAWAKIRIPWNPNLFFHRYFGSWNTTLFSFKITVKLPQVCRSFVCFVLG